jgi:hypothetical protein
MQTPCPNLDVPAPLRVEKMPPPLCPAARARAPGGKRPSGARARAPLASPYA